MIRLADPQMTREQAVAFSRDCTWYQLSPMERGVLQLRQDRLCMPFDAAQQGIDELLGRPVFPHEFADRDTLWAECEAIVPVADLEAMVDKVASVTAPA